MGTVETRKRIYKAINTMSSEQLDVVLDFLEDFQRSDEDETAMLMTDPGFMREYQDAREDIRTGKTVSFRSIRRNV
ncbi:hypothetical protein ACLG6S_04235 [Thermodesulfobacteriota bacterium B35]